MFDIEQFLDITNYATEERRSRRKNSEINSQEFFTWSFENWREMTEEEINNLIKQKKLNKKYARKTQ